MTSSTRLKRWRLLLGDSVGQDGSSSDGTGVLLEGDDAEIDDTLEALYDSEKKGSLGDSSPKIAKWLGDIRKYFPNRVVEVMQRDALERLGLNEMLLQPELLSSLSATPQLVATLLTLKDAMPGKTKETAREVVRKVVKELEDQLRQPVISELTMALNRASRTHRPRPADIDWRETVRLNLKNYQSELHTIIPEHIIGHARHRNGLRHIILCIDQSGSMAESVVFAGVFSAVLASMRAIETTVIGFDTTAVDLTHEVSDPVELLFGLQLGGGTDIANALEFARQKITDPQKTVLVLLSDLYEGNPHPARMLSHVKEMTGHGVNFVTLLALSDRGTLGFNSVIAAELAELDIPAFACTPDLFPEMMAAAIERRPLDAWASKNNLPLASGIGSNDG